MLTRKTSYVKEKEELSTLVRKPKIYIKVNLITFIIKKFYYQNKVQVYM